MRHFYYAALPLLAAVSIVVDTASICAWSQSEGTPPVVIQNLPIPNVMFRMAQVRAVRKDIVAASFYSLSAYTDDNAKFYGWTKYVVPRKGVIFGQRQTVFWLKVDPDAKTIDISIRGTNNLDDVLRDLQVGAIEDSRLAIPLHAGFQSIAVGVFNKLKSILTSNQLNNYSFRLYGHSLGGAVAAVVSMYLYQQGSNVDLVVTFGAPRFTTNEGARKYQVLNLRTYRIVRCDDVVPFLPPPNFFGWKTGGYEANGNVLLLLKPPYFDYSMGIDIERDFVYQLRTELTNNQNKEILAFGHRMPNYYSLVYEISPQYVAFEGGKELVPVSYTLKSQNQLCPPQLGMVHDNKSGTDQRNESKN